MSRFQTRRNFPISVTYRGGRLDALHDDVACGLHSTVRPGLASMNQGYRSEIVGDGTDERNDNTQSAPLCGGWGKPQSEQILSGY